MAESRLARFTHRRRTPFPTARIEAALAPAAHAVATIVWQRRHANERASVALAERMISAARASGVGADVRAALERFAADERAHVAAAEDVLARLDAKAPPAQRLRSPDEGEAPAVTFARDVVVGLCVCETVSAARFATVRAATDLPPFRALIDGFLRDELAHAGLGFALLDEARRLVDDAWIVRETVLALRELEGSVGLDGARRGLAPPRPQPSGNPGVVEPNLDALAFYRAVERRIVPRLAAQGLAIEAAWRDRFT